MQVRRPPEFSARWSVSQEEGTTMEAGGVPSMGIPMRLWVHAALPRPGGRWRRREGTFLFHLCLA